MSIAVIKAGGKQYIVKKGETLKIEKIKGKKGDKVNFDTLLTADGDKIEIGQPTLKTKTEAEIIEQGRSKKVLVIKYKAKTRYKRRVGHHQLLTKIKFA